MGWVCEYMHSAGFDMMDMPGHDKRAITAPVTCSLCYYAFLQNACLNCHHKNTPQRFDLNVPNHPPWSNEQINDQLNYEQCDVNRGILRLQ